jgi:hypothetical protein
MSDPSSIHSESVTLNFDMTLVRQYAANFGWQAFYRMGKRSGTEYRLPHSPITTSTYLEVDADEDGLVTEVRTPIFSARVGQGYTTHEMAAFAIAYLVCCARGREDQVTRYIPTQRIPTEV